VVALVAATKGAMAIVPADTALRAVKKLDIKQPIKLIEKSSQKITPPHIPWRGVNILAYWTTAIGRTAN